jgi:hypothetical protein
MSSWPRRKSPSSAYLPIDRGGVMVAQVGTYELDRGVEHVLGAERAG